MSKSWTPEELAAASAAMKAEGHMSYEEFCAAPVLRLEHRGRDSWDRPVYECGEHDDNSDMYEMMPFCNLSNYCPGCGAKMDKE